MVSRRRQLSSVTIRIATEVMDALQNSTGRTIWHLSESDRFRLYKLWIWSQRYKVSLEYIMPVLVNYFTKGVEKRTGKKSKGLGVSIPVLTGDVAEEILKKQIDIDFAEGDHLTLWQEQEIDRITDIIYKPPEFAVRVKKTLQYNSLAQEAAAYKDTISRAIKKSSKVEKKLKKIPWRGNPWR